MDQVPDLAVDFMDMRDDYRLLTRVADARPGFVPVADAYAVVGDEDSEARLARIIKVEADGMVELEVLPGPAASHGDLLSHR